ncbi:glutamine amidotransferase [Clostridium pasteurianum]|uniref:glutamine amidotransferase n=1 Tax=Clostridium pasteurianum TaxID=1501 RepID=UPI002260FC7C|nr:glutamine amidotransferase [Clostridium pasteurianum]UZW15396.1 glutamine amidotransferase [Clostridium pasteurianum]
MIYSKNKKIHIIKTGETYKCISSKFGDFEDMIINKLSLSIENVAVWPVYKDKILPDFEDIDAVIITGSHSMVTDFEDWSLYLADWIKKLSYKDIPMLGICYGHQLIAQAFGGVIGYHPHGGEFGSVNILLTENGKQDSLFNIMPDKFYGNVAHLQSVIKLPPMARVLAGNEFEKNHAFVINERIWSVQFHPEFNADILNAYIDESKAILEKNGHDIEVLKQSVVENDLGTKLLKRFIELI